MSRHKSSVISHQPSAVGYKVSDKKRWLFIIMILIAYNLLFTTSSAIAQKANSSIKQGNEAYRKNKFATAIKDYAKALQSDEKNVTARFNMANAQQRNGNEEASAANYDDVIKTTTDADMQAKAHYNKALAMLQQKNVGAAVDAFKQSLRLSPNDNEARENLQKALNEQKKQQEQNQKQNPDQKQQQQQQKKEQKQQPKMNREMMEQKFKELQEQEKKLQKDLQKQKTNQQEQEKDW